MRVPAHGHFEKSSCIMYVQIGFLECHSVCPVHEHIILESIIRSTNFHAPLVGHVWGEGEHCVMNLIGSRVNTAVLQSYGK